MKMLNKLPKWSYILIVFVLVIILNIITNVGNEISDRKIKNGKPDSETKKYYYISNNASNSDFEYGDIKKAELARYDKYINEEAEEILNQKIYVQIQKSDFYTDVSTATTKKFIIMAIDHDGNQWKIISEYPVSSMKNIKAYGLYKGFEIINGVKVPILDYYTDRIDLNYVNKDELKEISKVYLNKLSSIYSKEQFSYSYMEESVSSVDVIYKNKNNDIKIEVSVDVDDKSISSVNVAIIPSSIKFSDVDDNFWYSVIRSFNENISNNEANNMIIEAKADAIVKSDADHLILTEGQPMTTGIAALKGTQIEVTLFIRQMRIKKENSY